MPDPPLNVWPFPGGLLERLGQPPDQIEARSRAAARAVVGDRWQGDETELVASMVYAAGDPELVAHVRLGRDPVGHARQARARGAGILVDVTMVSTGIRLPGGCRMAVAVRAPGAEELARRSGTTRAAAGIKRWWDEFGKGGVVAIGNAPTALLATLDLAAASGRPACVIATCPGFHVAAEAKAALVESGLPYAAVSGSRGGSGLAAAAVNFLLENT